MDTLKNKQISTLEKHIEALYSSYEKMIDILNKEMDTKEDEDGNVSVTLKDAQIKSFADGVSKAAEAADSLLDRIQEKEQQLDKLKNPDAKSEKKKEQSSPLSSRAK
tara:strand:+ start:17574 stop:17894 length:321 start_codon:yes stop_codon:yes gene_type:complete